jgi:hypothetical protein
VRREQVVRAFSESELPQIVAKLATEALLKVKGADCTLNCDYLRVPVEFPEEFEEKSEQLHHCLHLKIVHQKDDQHVKGIGCHVCSVRAEQGRLICHPGLDEHDRFFEEGHSTRDLLHEVDSAKTARLSDTYINHSVSNCEFYDFDISSIDKHNVRNMKVRLVGSLPRRVFVALQLLLNHLKLGYGARPPSGWNYSYVNV